MSTKFQETIWGIDIRHIKINTNSYLFEISKIQEFKDHYLLHHL